MVRLPTRDVMKPKSGSVGFDTALPSLVRFSTLNASSLRSRCCERDMANDFRNDMLSSQKPGFRRKFFSNVVAYVPVRGAANADLSNHVARLSESSQSTCSAFGSPTVL